MSAPPWRESDSPLAVAISNAFERQDAAHGLDEPTTDPVPITPNSRALSFSGFDLDADELGVMLAGLARLTDNHIEHATLRRINDEDQPAPSPEDMRTIVILCLRGALGTAMLAGLLYGREHERQAGSGKPLPSTGDAWPTTDGLDQAIGRRPTDAERAELARDSVAWVLDLECDRLDRAAIALAVLGLERPARLMQAAAAELRRELEGGERERDTPR